jgi:TIGR03009 family protein
MRFLLVLPALLLASAVVLAQQPPPPPPSTQLDDVLFGWEKTFAGLQSLQAECKRTTRDKVFGSTEVFVGMAKYRKAPGQGSQASLELYKQTPQGPSPAIFEKYICTGTYLYEYSPANKVIRIHTLPTPKPGQVADDNFLSFLFGMKAVQAKQRYQLSLSPSDQYYHYLNIQAKSPEDKSDFTTAQLVLRRDNFLPARVWFHQPNGNETTWDFPRSQSNVNLPAADFQTPNAPPGWKIERVPTDAKSKIRSAGP